MSVESSVQPHLIKLSLIPDFEVVCDDAIVTIAPACQRLVSFVALRHGPVRRTVASGSLWWDLDDQRASACLRSALWRLRPLDLLCASATHLWLNPQVEVDLRRMVVDALTVLRGGPADRRLLDLAHELIDIGDDILLGWYEDWVVVEREQFRQIRLQALDRIGELLAEAELWYDALEVGLAATRAEPLRETAHRLVVRIHLMQGNAAEAVRQYRRYADLLQAELDVRPSRLLIDLVAPFLHAHAEPTSPG